MDVGGGKTVGIQVDFSLLFFFCQWKMGVNLIADWIKKRACNKKTCACTYVGLHLDYLTRRFWFSSVVRLKRSCYIITLVTLASLFRFRLAIYVVPFYPETEIMVNMLFICLICALLIVGFMRDGIDQEGEINRGPSIPATREKQLEVVSDAAAAALGDLTTTHCL